MSSTALTETVWAVSQLPGVKVRVMASENVPLLPHEDEESSAEPQPALEEEQPEISKSEPS